MSFFPICLSVCLTILSTINCLILRIFLCVPCNCSIIIKPQTKALFFPVILFFFVEITKTKQGKCGNQNSFLRNTTIYDNVFQHWLYFFCKFSSVALKSVQTIPCLFPNLSKVFPQSWIIVQRITYLSMQDSFFQLTILSYRDMAFITGINLKNCSSVKLDLIKKT